MRTRRIILMGVESHYGRGVTAGIDRYFREHGEWEYWMGPDNTPETVKQAAALVTKWKAVGIIAFVRTDRVKRFARRAGIPAVTLAMRHLDLPRVGPDQIAVGRMAAEHFLASGFRQFAFCSLNPGPGVQMRCRGFCERLAESGFPCAVFTDRYAGEVDAYRVSNLQRMGRWLMTLKKPVAIMGVYDPKALEVVWACRHMGLRVPDDVAVVGVGNDELHCATSRPALSSVELDLPRIGYEAARLLHHLIRGGKPPAQPVEVQPLRVILRQSSDILALEDVDLAAALRFIRDHTRDGITVKDILQAVPICRRRLERRFVELIGRTPHEEITRVRLELARRLLEETDFPMPLVARQSGFPRRVIFSGFFRRATGATPTQYRRQFRLGRQVHSLPG